MQETREGGMGVMRTGWLLGLVQRNSGSLTAILQSQVLDFPIAGWGGPWSSPETPVNFPSARETANLFLLGRFLVLICPWGEGRSSRSASLLLNFPQFLGARLGLSCLCCLKNLWSGLLMSFITRGRKPARSLSLQPRLPATPQPRLPASPQPLLPPSWLPSLLLAVG